MAFPTLRLLRQTATYEAYLGQDQRDDRQYAAPVTVACRIVEIDRERYRQTEDVRDSATTVWMATQPAVLSRINGREVFEVAAMVDHAGVTAGWKASLR